MPKSLTEPNAAETQRIAKRIARAGVCSRREAEALILDGRVTVNGKTIESPALDVGPDDVIMVDRQRVPDAEPTRLFRYHKPRGEITAASDPDGRTTIYASIPPSLPRLMPIGRLDIGSEGLLLLTNDGELKRRLELPATGWIRRYRCRVYGEVDEKRLAALANGVTVEGVVYGPIDARLVGSEPGEGDNRWMSVSLREGKNREVRRVMAHLGLQVSRLMRLAYGPFQLGSLERRRIEEVPTKVLREQLGTAKPGAATAKPRRSRGPAR